MEAYKLGPVESVFADLIWEREPLASGELVALCQEKLEWKKSTTYTVLRKLCDKGLFQNRAGQVTSLISRAEYQAMQTRQFVEDTFDGSLPAMIAAFTNQRPLTDQEAEEIRRMIDRR